VGDATIYDQYRKELKLPPGSFWLGDGGFGLRAMEMLSPYRGVRYHLKEWSNVPGLRPQNYKELFNYRHAQLRNVIERVNGIWKRRFRVFAKKLEFELETVNMLVYVTVCLHNLICMEDRDNLYEDVDADAFVAYEDDDEDMREQYEEMKEEVQSEPENLTAKVWRDNIAKKLWAQYKQHQRRKDRRARRR
jgi:hypothetical protein